MGISRLTITCTTVSPMPSTLSLFPRIIRQIWLGQLHRAAEFADQGNLNSSLWGRGLARYLTGRLVRNAFWNWQQNNFAAAWADFAMADRAVPASLRNWLTAQKSRLVEETIRASDKMLAAGQAQVVADALASLKDQKILDWRADRTLIAARWILEAERLSRQGHWQSGWDRLQRVAQQRGDLHYLQARIELMKTMGREHGLLIQKLRQAICGNRLDAARLLSDQILAISPEDATGLAARSSLGRAAKAELLETQAPARNPTSQTAGQSGAAKPAAADPATRLNQPGPSCLEVIERDTPHGDAIRSVNPTSRVENFLMWIDGVGGFLVCVGPQVHAGSFVDQPGIDIPVQADLRRRHLRMELHHDQFVLVPFGPVSLNGQSISQAVTLAADQRIELTGQVKWRFRQPHGLSSSARIDFASPHRTVPWSDAILLLADTLIIGPQRQNHVVCPSMKNDLILFRRQGKLFVRSETPVRVDGRLVGGVASVQTDSAISGEDFSIQLEPVGERIRC